LSLNPNSLSAARTLDSERKSGKLRGPLHGIPILVKDNIETRDPVATTAGSYALARSFRPADAPLAARLRAAGAIILGKANLSEWANFRSTRSCSGWSGVGGQVGNAYDPARNPSGSSAGSGVAAAASFCAAAIGTETNGSILSPSSINGLVGFKPTVGVVSGKGVVPISPRQDTAGPMCRTVGDAAILASVIAERPLGFGAHGTDIEAFRLRGVRVGVMPVPQGAHPDTTRLFADARAVLEHEGAVTVDLKPPKAFDEMGEQQLEGLLYEFKDAINAYLATLDPSQVDCKTLTDLIAFNRAHADQELVVFGQEIFEMADAKGPLSDAAYQTALATLKRTADVEGLATLLGQGVELLMGPSNGPADLIDPVWGDRRGGGSSQIASAAAIAGYPSLTAPAGLVDGLPVGITLVTGRNQDGLLLQVARAYERAANARVPPHLLTMRVG
jgi:amidase